MKKFLHESPDQKKALYFSDTLREDSKQKFFTRIRVVLKERFRTTGLIQYFKPVIGVLFNENTIKQTL